jgi:type IV secretion system protein VirB9
MRKSLTVSLFVASFVLTSSVAFAQTHAGAATQLALPPISAQSLPVSLPTDTRMAVLPYNPSQIYTVLTAPTRHTHVELEKGEKLIVDPALGDTTRWEVEHVDNNIFIKPSDGMLDTNLTLISNRRTYQFTLISSPAGGKYYQHVKFRYSNSSDGKLRKLVQAEDVEERGKQTAVAVKFADPTELNTNYRISGDAKFRPEQVMDNGKFTYIKFPSTLVELPVIYVREDGNKSVVNVIPKKHNYIEVQRIADEIVLELDKEQVRISKGGRSWFSSFGGDTP